MTRKTSKQEQTLYYQTTYDIMTNYFSQYMPNIGSNQPISNISPDKEQGHIKSIIIFNPSLSPTKSSITNEELYNQILIVVPELEESDKLEYVKLIGLIRGIDSFAKTFVRESNEPTIIKSSKTCILIIQIQQGFYLACSIGVCHTNKKLEFFNQQVIKLIIQAHSRFTLFNKSLTIEDLPNLKKKLGEFWQGFVVNYNQQLYKYPQGLTWFNSLNYRGFLGMFPGTTFKKSSIELNPSLEFELDKLEVKGLIVYDFDKINTKRSGMIYCKSKELPKTSLLDIYNLVEFYQYHDKLNELVKNDNFNTNLQFEYEEDGSDYTSGILQVLNPVNITNNLVVSPLNYTINGVRSLVGNEQTEDVSQEVSETTPWLALPRFIKNLSIRETNIEEEIPTEPESQFIIGLTKDGITRKTVYIQDQEYQLIIYGKGNIYIILIYEPTQFDSDFYTSLQQDLNPIIEDINIEGGSLIQTSLTSLRGLLTPELDQDFFYIILDTETGSCQTSLPYLQVITTTTTKYEIAMCYLHDQLTNLFVIHQQSKFFEQVKLTEYFHKFTSNKLNDWMFYYIYKNNKFILIIKNKNKTNEPTKIEQSLLKKISNGVLDLGFLDSLSDDVKYWLGREVTSDIHPV